jgi:anti-sigma28 factor (negative regulator of flagellin synthesis)
MRISGSDLPQPISSGSQSKAPRPAAGTRSENYQTADLLAISAAASAASSSAERVDQLKLQVDSGEYFQSSTGIAQRLISDALARTF